MSGGFDTGYSTGYDSLTVSGGGGGWEALLGIIRTDRAERAADEALPPVACPVHGEPLKSARGVLHCAVGHFVGQDSTIY